MNEARQAFEALLVSKGKKIPAWDGAKYKTPNVQSYWRWFLLGWQMNNISNGSVIGAKRSNEDKCKAVEALIDDPDWSQWSDSEIARHAGVSHQFVSKIREEKVK